MFKLTETYKTGYIWQTNINLAKRSMATELVKYLREGSTIQISYFIFQGRCKKMKRVRIAA